MGTRPRSITIISWFIIVFGLLNIIVSIANLINPFAQAFFENGDMPLWIYSTIGISAGLLSIVFGFGMLNGHGWARILFLFDLIVSTVIGFINSTEKLSIIPIAIVYLIIVFFLFRPVANQYFSKKTS